MKAGSELSGKLVLVWTHKSDHLYQRQGSVYFQMLRDCDNHAATPTFSDIAKQSRYISPSTLHHKFFIVYLKGHEKQSHSLIQKSFWFSH